MKLTKYWKVWILILFLIGSIIVINPLSPRIHFGLDIQGGLWAIVEPEGNVSYETLLDARDILIQRTSSLREASFQIVRYENRRFIQIQIAGGTEEDLNKLINTTGIFEAKIPLTVKLVNGSGKLKIGEQSHWPEVNVINNESVLIAGEQCRINRSCSINGIEITVTKINDDKIDLLATVYKNAGGRKDIIRVYSDPQHSYIRKSGNFYEWKFDVEISNEAANRFFDVVRNLDVVYEGGKSYLSSKLLLYLDNKLVNNLSIGASLKQRPVTQATVSGAARTLDEARDEKRFLQLVLRSGALPTKLKIVSIKKISPKLGTEFMNNIGYVAIAALTIVSIIIFLRYRTLKLSLLVIFTMLSEIIILLGASVIINWTIDLAALAAILAVVGTGVDQQIMIIDEIRVGEKLSLRVKIKRAFFIIFGAAGTTFAAMLPLMTIGFGLLRGFALTTALGVIIGVLITRPAFTQMVEKLIKE